MAPLKFKRALRSAARLPGRVTASRSSSARSASLFAPQPNELPLVLLRIQVLGCTALIAKDRNGYSDPFVVVSVLNTRQQTPVAKRTVNPTYVPKDATWDFALFVSTAKRLGAVEMVVWDKYMVGKEYLGEVAIPLDEWWGEDGEGRGFGWDDPANKPFTVNLQSTRAGTAVSGAVHVKLGFIKPAQSQTRLEFDEIFSELVKRSRPSLVSAPPTSGVGTIRSNEGRPELQDDGGLSSSDDGEGDSDDDDDFVDAPEISSSNSSSNSSPLLDRYTPPAPKPTQPLPQPPLLTVQPSSPVSDSDSKTPTASIAGVLTTPTTAVSPVSPSAAPPTSASIPGPPPATTKPPSSPSFAKKIFPLPIPLPRRLSGLTSSPTTSSSSTSASSLSTPAPAVPPPSPLIDPVSGALVPGTPASAPEEGAVPIPTPSPGVEGKKSRLWRRSWVTASPNASAGSTPSSTPPTPTPGAEGGELVTPVLEGVTTTTKKEKGRKARRGAREGKGYSLDAQNDILGIVMLEVLRVEDLPKLKNMTRTGWDMDPFVVVSFGKKVFRTRVIRHSLNPTFEEKLVFHVRLYETTFSVQLAVHDWDKLSSNDHIGNAGFESKNWWRRHPRRTRRRGCTRKRNTGNTTRSNLN